MMVSPPANVKSNSAAPAIRTSPPSGLLQRKCACGGSPGVDGECAECRSKRLRSSSSLLQPKLTINEPGDRYEREADRVADMVTRIPERSATNEAARPNVLVQPFRDEPIDPKISRVIQRQVGVDEEEEEEGELVRAKAQPGHTPTVDAGSEAFIRSLPRRGQPLDPATRGWMAARFGHDFSTVRVHTDSRADVSARAVRARAYTVGPNIVFGAGQYAPHTRTGQRLLAHELTHVVQQGESPRAGVGLQRQEEEEERPEERTGSAIGKKRGGPEITQDGAPPDVQRACKGAATSIGRAANCTGQAGDVTGDPILFLVDCNDFLTPAELQKVADFADSMTESDKVNIHGFASEDGPEQYNLELSCARARQVADELEARRILPAQVSLFQHGETPGPKQERRSVVLERVPNVSRTSVPQLSAVIVGGGPTPGICGVMNFAVQWQLSRNSAANGGFVVQDLTITWDNRDCAGNVVPDATGKTSPLRYFEAWRLNPNSQNFAAADGSTDNFIWVNDDPTGCTTDRVTFTGIAHYHDDVANGAMPAHMTRRNPATFAGSLRSSLTDPGLGGNVSRPFDHDLTFSWDCCPCQSSPTVVESHNP